MVIFNIVILTRSFKDFKSFMYNLLDSIKFFLFHPRIFQNLERRRSSLCWIKVPGHPSSTHSPPVHWDKTGSLRPARLAWSTWGIPATWTASYRRCSWPQSESHVLFVLNLCTVSPKHMWTVVTWLSLCFPQFQAACFIFTTKWFQHADEKAPAALRVPCSHSGLCRPLL